MDIFHMSDIIPLIGLPYPPYGRSNYNVPCPCCDDEPHAKHLNINLQKDVFRCPRCGFSGGIFDLYAYYTGIAREEVRDALIARLDVQGSIPKPEHIPVPVVAEVPPTDIASRSDTYTGLLSKLTLASDHRQNLRNRGLSDEEIDRLGYRTTPVVGMQTIARQLQSSGYYLSGVPGFYRKDGKWSFACESRGVLIPVRDSKGRIQGMQIRRDNATRRKFRWVSSTGRTDGCKAEGWVHIAGEPRAMVLLTEGPMKADVIPLPDRTDSTRSCGGKYIDPIGAYPAAAARARCRTYHDCIRHGFHGEPPCARRIQDAGLTAFGCRLSLWHLSVGSPLQRS